MYIPLEQMKAATELTKRGKLFEATQAIRRALGIDAREPPPSEVRDEEPVSDVIDVEFREIDAPPVELPQRSPSTFDAHRFSSGGRTYAYRLFMPQRDDDSPLPVIVMLHGCTQDAADFAAGTAMNDVAADRKCIVVYPEQLARSNNMRCWNWFDPAHKQRGGGEPAMIAALATHVVQRCNGDASRVYVAGLSAGGAMATVVGQLYPDVFAAVGVHSGIPDGIANDVPSAYAAMRKPSRKASTAGAAVPTIVFHGLSDKTVHPDNGRQVIEDAAARMAAAGIALEKQEERASSSDRAVRRVVYRDASGAARLEHWEIDAGTHAWSGGSPSGTYTQAGPSASEAMVDFFTKQQGPLPN